MRKTLTGLLALLFILMPAISFAGQFTDKQLDSLQVLDAKLYTVQELQDKQVLSAEQAVVAGKLYTDAAKAIVGHDVTAAELHALVKSEVSTEGLGTFWNTVVVFAGILFLLGVLGLVAFYFKDFLEQIPPGAYEMMAYGGTALLLFSGYLWQPFHIGAVSVEPLWFAIPGALALAGCIALTRGLHFEVHGGRTSRMGPGFFDFPVVMFGLCTVAWGLIACFYNSIYPAAGIPHVLAFASVIALQAAMGFSVITMPGCVALGWESEKQIPKSVVSSLIILGLYVALKLSGNMTGPMAIFETGAIFMGAFVYFLGLLIMSSKWYSKENYVQLQVVTIISGIAAFYLGNAFHIGGLLGVGGTFFVLYLLEKYYEIPWKGIGWAWSFLGLALFLYFVVGFANSHPQYFIWSMT
ncbi:MAG TPA: hypothetical protein PKN86_07310 [Candidatus Obscuribacter sp.]|nr:hypothetical protein [Candidatus Obscuribacter sp.]HMX47726.1 hypothetical protein [Candidatus Obscuribacter sp.]HMY04297.1 hypothetical protein [Candidatus Obscuribacter sp.]HMY51427.1 hypothetical protein [Candidatus Obscuribacter sp.]HNB15842.1 hypothetical protein [Candidatus Obscuribacter sp.]